MKTAFLLASMLLLGACATESPSTTGLPTTDASAGLVPQATSTETLFETAQELARTAKNRQDRFRADYALLKAAREHFPPAILALSERIAPEGAEVRDLHVTYKINADALLGPYRPIPPEIMYRIGLARIHGHGRRVPDLEDARSLLRRAAEEGHGPAAFKIAEIFTNPAYDYADDVQALYWFHKAAEAGIEGAEARARALETAGVDISNMGRIRADLQRRAEDLNDADAQYQLGFLHQFGIDGATDFPLARKYHTLAAEQGHLDARFALSELTNGPESLVHQQIAADRGHGRALWAISLSYQNGDWASTDFERRDHYLGLAAEAGHPMSQYWWSFQFSNPNSPHYDPQTALVWLTRAAEQGVTLAHSDLGYLAETRGGQENLSEAVRLYRKGAELHDSEAMRLLAISYHEGRGVERNMERYLHWIQKAADLGNPRALEHLADHLLKGDPAKGEPQRGLKIYEWLALREGGDLIAEAAVQFFNVDHGLSDPDHGFFLMEWGVEQGNPRAMRILAELLKRGDWIEQDLPRAEKLLAREREISKAGN